MKLVFSIIGIITFILMWQLISVLGFVNSLFLPSPLIILITLANSPFSQNLWLDIVSTLARTLAGFIIAVIIGIPLGMLMGFSEKIYNTFEFLIDFFRSIPATALIPLFALFFGIGNSSKIFLIAFVSALIIAFNTMYGVKNGKALRKITGKLLGLSNWKLFTKIIFPESLPYVFVGLRVAISSAFIVVIVSEMFIGTQVGIGHRIIDAQLIYDSPSMYVAIIIAGIMGYLINRIFVFMERDIVKWARK